MRERYLFNIGYGEGRGVFSAPTAGWDGYCFGSESCSHLLPASGELDRIRRLCGSSPCVLVTPLAGPSEFEKVLRTARDALGAGWDEVVVNDWGVLSELSPGNPGSVTGGRLLLRSRRGPGSFDPWRDLDEESRRYFAWGPLYDGPFLSFLRNMGVSRLEIDPPRHWMPVPDVQGFSLSFHGDFRLISLASRCPWLHNTGEDRWERPARCPRGCLESGCVLLYADALKKPLVHLGREILEDASDDWREEDLPDTIDRLIYAGFGTESAGVLGLGYRDKR